MCVSAAICHMWPVPESQTVWLSVRLAIHFPPRRRRLHIMPRARTRNKARPAARAVHPIQIRYIFSARGTPVSLRFRPGTSISRPRVTRLVSVAFSVAFPCGVSPARRRGRGHIVNSSWRLPPSRDPRPDPHQALAWAPLSTTATPIFYVQPLACRCASHVCSSARAACWRASSTLAATLG
jgi:hypothetical protein